MKYLYGLGLLSLSISTSLPTFAEVNCATHQPCQIGQSCECLIPASSAYGRYYYFDFSTLDKNKHYQCNFDSMPLPLTIVLEGSTFPVGVTYQCSGNCPRFPLTLTLDTTNMQMQNSDFTVKYFVPGSDSKTTVLAKCSIARENL